MAFSRALVCVVFLGVVAVVASRVAVESFNHVRLQHTSTNQQLGGLPIKINVRKHNEPEYDFGDQDVGPEVEPETEPDVPPPSPSLTRPMMGPGATPCQTVSQWEGRASEWDHLKGGNNRFNITVDGVNRRKRIMEDKHAQLPGKRIYEYIMMFDDGYQFVINHNYNTCAIMPLGTWRNHTIPPNATLEDFYEIGAPGSGFLVQEWSDRIPARQRESWIGTYTDKGCWPVMEIFMEKAQNNTMVQSVSTRFFDLTAGIKDPSIFNPPSYCPQPGRRVPLVRPNLSARPANALPVEARPSRRQFPEPARTRPDLSRKLSILRERLPEEADPLIAKLDRLAESDRLPEEGLQLLKKLKSGHQRIPGRGIARTIKVTGK